MKISQQRFALLTGVSVSALGLASPAAAATTTNPGIGHNVSAPSVSDELVISAIGDQGLFGVTVDGTATAFAIVDSSANGEIAQVANAFGASPTGGYLTMTALNGGTVTIAADAHATSDSGAATARAHVERAVVQSGLAGVKSAINLANSGNLTVEAKAEATGTAAHANATLSTGVLQIAAGPDASIALSNDGTIELSAIAIAEASQQSAVAIADLNGIDQAAHGQQSADVAFVNDGTIDIAASGHATGFGSANASANLGFGIAQTASASDPITGRATVSLDNGGTIAIGADAQASAEASAFALAFLHTAIYQHATGSAGGAAASMTNSGTMSLAASAAAGARNDGMRDANATAVALVGGFHQDALAQTRTSNFGSSSGSFWYTYKQQPHGPASVELENSGTISLVADAQASGDNFAHGLAVASVGAQTAHGTSASVTLDNSGSISGAASAGALAGQMAQATASVAGLHQSASAWGVERSIMVTASGAGHSRSLIGGVGPASVTLTNSGSISMVAVAHAADTATALAASQTMSYAAASAFAAGIGQTAWGTDVNASIGNGGTIKVAADAVVTALQSGFAQAHANGFGQAVIGTGGFTSLSWNQTSFTGVGGKIFSGDVDAELTNNGVFDVEAAVSDKSGGVASATGKVLGGSQIAKGLTAISRVLNSGTYSVAASADMTGGSEFAFMVASGLRQEALGADSALASVANSGTMSVDVAVHGVADGGIASNIAVALGIEQDALSIGTATAILTNSGKFSVGAEAEASGGSIAFAGAAAIGVSQYPLFGKLKASLNNSADITVSATASAVATGNAYASARATGLYADAADIVANITNSGSLLVSASAAASGAGGSVHAYAGGISMVGYNHGTSAPAGSVAGSIINSGDLEVLAKASGANGSTLGATATGIYLKSTRNNATIVNSGRIDVEAVTAHGGPAIANGIRLVTGELGDPAQPGDVFTFTNDGGTMIVRQSEDGGDTWKRGMAIDVSQAPNASVINLVGDGTLYGDIAIQDGDKIKVSDGTTYFDGIINPASIPATGITAAQLDSGLHGVGTLSIVDGGNLVLANPKLTGPANMYDGPAYALVDTLDVASDGTLTFELQPTTGGVQSVGSYVQIFADTANLDGTLVADVTTANGLFADSYSWQNVIDANVLTGKFDECLLGGRNAGSLLLNLTCSYDSNNNVDLKLTRTPFDQVAGLNANGVAVGTGLDSYFDVNLRGGAANMFADLFLISDAANFNVALNQLSGSVYANYLNSFPSLGVHYDDLVDHATNCEIPALAGSVLECRASSPIHIWGQLDYQTRKADGDVEAGDSRSKRFTGLVGVDTNLASTTILGIEGGYVSNNVHDDQFGDSAKGNGWQIGAYADYDPGAVFVKGVTTYSSFSGDSTRHINFSGLGTGTSFSANPTGSPDVKMWTFGLHGGARFSMSANSVITPYLNYDYVNAELDGFDEDNGNGAGLTIGDGKSNHSYLTGGVKWATQMGGVVPELNLGYRYRFGDQRSSVHEWFTPDPENDFNIISSAQKKGAFLAGVSIGGKVGPVDLRIGYEGEFNGDVTSHSGNFKIVLPLGGHAASPPPAVAAPAPPPPAAEPAPPPPPPPMPVERGERGE